MVFHMEIYVNGRCRGGEGVPGTLGAAAAAFKTRDGTYHAWTRSMPPYPPPSRNRAVLFGIIEALRQVLDRLGQLYGPPYLVVRIYLDSQYAVRCMTSGIYRWVENGWRNAAGKQVCNRDLLEEAAIFDDRVKMYGEVDYVWVPKEENTYAYNLCTEDIDRQLNHVV
ncbi:hypothetical protein ACHAPE_009001 [Trichoderma viride]